jgi:hypothetical protein
VLERTRETGKQEAGYRIQDTGYRIQDTRYRIEYEYAGYRAGARRAGEIASPPVGGSQ